MRFQIRTMQVPRRGAGAFTPCMTPIATAAFNGQNIVTGMPGTVPIASPRPAALNDQGLGGTYNQPSSCAPNYFLPSIYTGHANPTLRFPGKILSDNVMPVPAGSSQGLPKAWAYTQRIGGRVATSAVRPFTQWPTYGGVA